jgi:hypothetical protein
MGYKNAKYSLKRNWVIPMLALNIMATLHRRPGFKFPVSKKHERELF